MFLFKFCLISFVALVTAHSSGENVVSNVVVSFSQNGNETVQPHCVNTRFVVKNRQDLYSILDCKVLKGNLEIIDYEDPILTFPHLNYLDGSLLIRQSPHLIRIEAQELSRITGGFSMEKLTSLAMVVMPALTSVKFLEWRVLPIFGNLKLGELTGVESVIISDTSLAKLTVSSADVMRNLDLNNNRFLEFIKFDVKHINDLLHIGANGRNAIVDLDLLQSAHNMSIHNVADIKISNLELIKGSASIINNSFHSINFTNLENVEGTLSIAQNDQLALANFPSVSEIGGGLSIVNNTFLQSISFFPKLNVIGGALDLVGNIRYASWDKLKLVKGSARLTTTVPTFDCKKWAQRDVGTIIRGGKIECFISLPSSKDEGNVLSQPPKVALHSGSNLLSINVGWIVVAVLSAFIGN
ncbi:putative sporulation-specific protein [Clavispora lusitaniae]|uniref:Receptor L-domain domain-containing protein n=2 Tax=Clavispora lusitaniae TaxID=36911 RepID=C4Y9E0_CLAL4|nr:uncharacterized protein CLUG_04818 [Clavispora lusitaniae ATCC 42720]KAF5209392.1 hypothetical protein E0198_003690 [Clavispora lusitaniae]EEQ40690.1 hypothetical protein CLUG_04818 [Clavispora lusitaniae ATCC 42720]KAF7581400.1 Receptor L domain family protein [Clavispora lusitaniae]QFZ28809.1 putative sporulation-specific protein [Clavispora lusitaniae]QFZ34472.1 putative sporulation-specific protein [Clavispora lusitaniae]